MFKTLKSVLKGSFGINTNSWKTKLLSEWPTIVGTLHDKMTVEKVYEDTIVIGVYEASWLQELYMLSAVLIKTINSHLDKPYIKKIRFKHASRTVQKHTVKKHFKKTTTERKKITLNSIEARALLKIKDKDTRDALHSFLSRCKTKDNSNI
jgi:hypothetical protein